jgi:hypothetical protein
MTGIRSAAAAGETPRVEAPCDPPAAAAPPTVSCLGCGAALSGRFCAACGQPIALRLSGPGLARSALQQVLELDFASLRTFVGLSWRPGRTPREYVEGRRSAYLNPLKYALLTTTLFVFLITILQARTDLLGDHAIHPLSLVFVYVLYLSSAAGNPGVLAFGLAAMPYLDWFVRLLPYATFILLLPLSGLQRYSFRRTDVNVSECYVFQIFVFGHLMLVHLLLILLGFYRTTPGFAAAHLVELGYLSWALHGFYGGDLRRNAAAAFVLLVSHRVFFAATFLLVLGLNT